MTDFILEIFYRLPLWKTAIILGFALIGALLQEASFLQRVLTFFIGIAAATTFTEPLIIFFDLKPGLSDATAGVLAMSGRNMAAFTLRISRDPFKATENFLKFWRGKR
ncbi:hypothetical protein PsAD2_04265 [Pseudovibrio axinellae]|uniref:Uncharacterized protein n=1 Tax=Pseudovibrio axinellae TaxID=989403 RepID=A0A165TX15_9HYPH|nr:hypothetical protein [Pseudovibrio axinellae]KZL06752.1 hypothetical protein PsAD2_04265 [Pseudovibrio axinellae]SER62963.1 hypothetical protein SAMN05421798_11477 [Pseudovibrio axinellae]